MNGGGVLISAKDVLPLLSVLTPQELLKPVDVKPIVVTPTTFEAPEEFPTQPKQDTAKTALSAKELLASLRPPGQNFASNSARNKDFLAALRLLSQASAGGTASGTAKDSQPVRQSMKQVFQQATKLFEWSAALPRQAAATPGQGQEASLAQHMKAAGMTASMFGAAAATPDATTAKTADMAPQDKQLAQSRQGEAAAKPAITAAQTGGTHSSSARAASPATNSAMPANAATAQPAVAEQLAQATIRERSASADIHAPHSSAAAMPAEMELPVILNAGMLPVWMAASQLKGPLNAGMFMKVDDEQILKYLLSIGVKETLMQKIKKALKKAKKSNKMMICLLAMFASLNMIADRVVEELSAFMDEDDEVMDRLANADAHGAVDERRRVYLG